MITYQQADRLRTLTGRLKRRSEIRPILMEIAEGRPQGDESLQLLHKAALGRTEGRCREKVAALWGLAYAGLVSGDTDAARATLRTVLRNREANAARRALQRIGWAFVRTVFSMAALAVVGTAAFELLDNASALSGLFAVGAALIFVVAIVLVVVTVLMPLGSVMGDWMTQMDIRTEAARALAEVATPADIPVLCDANDDIAGTVQTEAAGALRRLLPTLTSDDYGRLPAATTPALCRRLNDADFYLVCLTVEALGKVGDGRAVRSLDRLTRYPPSETIRQAAQKALPMVVERQRRETAPAVLVRPSEDPAGPDDSLLRPAAVGRPPDADTLPRPVDSIPAEPNTQTT
jgi:hypothetical protein